MVLIQIRKPGAAADASEGGGSVTNPNNALLDDATCAAINGANGIAGTDDSFLGLDTFNFNIPADATVTGLRIIAQLSENVPGGTSNRTIIPLVSKSGRAAQENQPYGYTSQGFGSNNNYCGATESCSTVAEYTDEGLLAAYTWSAGGTLTLTPAEVNSDNFAIFLKIGASTGTVTGYVDVVEVTVFYTLPAVTHKVTIGTEESTLTGVTGNVIVSKRLNMVSTMDVPLMVETAVLENLEVYEGQHIRKYLPYDGTTLEFWGIVIEARKTGGDRHNCMLKCMGIEGVMRDLDIETYSAKQRGPLVIDTVTDGGALGFIGDADGGSAPGGYGANDHAVFITPGSKPNFTTDDFDVGSKSNGTDGSAALSWANTEANVNDQAPTTYLGLTASESNNFTYMYMQLEGSSTNPKANVKSARVYLSFSFYNVTSQQTVTLTLQYYDNNLASWEDITSRTVVWPGISFPAYIDITMDGWVDTNEILDGADDFKIRLRGEIGVATDVVTMIMRVYAGGVDLYTGTQVYSSYFQIDNYEGDDSGMNVSPVDLTNKGVAVGQYYEIGLKNTDVITALANLFDASALPFSIDGSALSGYTSKSFAGMTLMDAITYICDLTRGAWYFDHNALTLYIVEETDIVAGVVDFVVGVNDYYPGVRFERKATKQYRKVTLYGAKYQIVDDADATQNVSIQFNYPQDSTDSVDTRGARKTHKDDYPDVTMYGELGRMAKYLFERLNGDYAYISFLSEYNDDYALGTQCDFEHQENTYSNYPVQGVTTITDISADHVTQTVELGFQATNLHLRTSRKYNLLNRRLNRALAALRETPTYAPGAASGSGSGSHSPVTVAGAPLTLSDQQITFNYSTGLQLSGNNLVSKDSEIDHDSLLNFVANEHINWTNATANLLTTGTIKLAADNINFSVGAGDDLYFYHNAANSFIANKTGNLYITTNVGTGAHLVFQTPAGGAAHVYTLTGGVVYIQDADDANASLWSLDTSARVLRLFTAADSGEVRFSGDTYKVEADGDCVFKDGSFANIAITPGGSLSTGGAGFNITADVIMAAAKDVDCVTNGAYLKPRYVSQAAQPTPDTNELLIWIDTDDNTVYLVFNDPTSGVVQVQLT